MDAYTKAIELNPAYAEAYANRGNVKKIISQHEAALTDYDQAIRLNPNFAGFYYNRGSIKSDLGCINEARADYQQALTFAQKAGDAALATIVERALSRLDNNEAP